MAMQSTLLHELLRLSEDVYIPLPDKITKAKNIIEKALETVEVKALAIEIYLQRACEIKEEPWE